MNMQDKIEFYRQAIISYTYYLLGSGYKINDIDDIINFGNDDLLKDQFEITFNNTVDDVLKEINELVKSTRRDLAKEYNKSIADFIKEYNEVKAEEIIYNRYIARDASENLAKEHLAEDLKKKYREFELRYNLN